MKKPFKNMSDLNAAATRLECFLVNPTDLPKEEFAQSSSLLSATLAKHDFHLIDGVTDKIYFRADQPEIVAMESIFDSVIGALTPSEAGRSILTLSFLGVLEVEREALVYQLDNMGDLESKLAAYLGINEDAIFASPKCINPYVNYEEGFKAERYVEVEQARNFIIDAGENIIFAEDTAGETANEDGTDDDVNPYENPMMFDVSFDMEQLSLVGITDRTQLEKKLEAFIQDEDLGVFESTISDGETAIITRFNIQNVGGVISTASDNGYYLEYIDFLFAYDDCADLVEGKDNLAVRFTDSDFIGHASVQIEILDRRSGEVLESYDTRPLYYRSIFIEQTKEQILISDEMSAENRVLH